VPAVRVIGAEAEQLGIMTVQEALRMARERNVDLVEVAPQAAPPVCRLMDYGKFRYEQAKKEREARKHQHTVELREIRFHPKIGVHDVNFKMKHAHELLEEGDKVKVSVLFRGRENTHPELGHALLARFVEGLKDVAVVERPVMAEGRTLNVILAPGKAHKPVPVPAKPSSELS